MSDDIVTSVKPFRAPQDNIPQSRQQREELLQIIREYVNQKQPVGPLSMDELKSHTDAVLEISGVDGKYSNFISVLINNEAWRDTLAGIPYEKRLLLLAKCLRSHGQCPASFDELGLVCEHCGRCVIDELKRQAEELGYAVLIAEGSPVVMSLIETGKIEAVVGVSCLSVLEEVFPYMESGAVPGIAIPLLQDGCANTNVDVDWVLEAIYQTNEDQSQRLNLNQLRQEVSNWFTTESLSKLIQMADGDQTQELAVQWLGKAGKRWRPFLSICTYEALTIDKKKISQEDLQRVAVAVECFHKASLIHDDIEDGDMVRYHQKTLHAEYGIPIALNIGDFLLGEGYRLLNETSVSDRQKTKLIQAAAEGHRDLCLGQGKELSWLHNRRPLSVDEVLGIFSMKTAPAFEVALKIGAIIADYDVELNGVLKNYSQSLGIAYQINDDLEDLVSTGIEKIQLCHRPSILLALAYQLSTSQDKDFLKSVWENSIESESDLEKVLNIFKELEIEKITLKLKESYKSRAIGSLIPVKNVNLKSLLRRVMSKIFNDFDNMGCCDDHQNRNASGREQSEKNSG